MSVGVLFYALVVADCRETVELFVRRADAERALADVLRDEPGFDGWLEIIVLDFRGPEVKVVGRPRGTMQR